MRTRWLPAAMSVAILFLSTAAAAEIMSISAKKANVREGPGTGYPVLWQAWRYTPFEVLEWSGEWVYVEDFVGDIGWVHVSVLSETPAVIVAGKYANIRTGPGLNYEAIWRVDNGYPLKVIERSGNWLKVMDDGDEDGDDKIYGWIFLKLVWGNINPEEEEL